MLDKIIRNLKEPRKLAGRLVKIIKNKKRYTAEDRAYWESLKNSARGKRAFVIGNGPSLTMPDLELLKDEVTIASNKIFLAFNEVSWRPSYYTAADPILWDKIKDEVSNHFDTIHIPTYLDRENNGKIRYWLAAHMGLFERFSGDMSKKAYSGQTITYENIQLAVHLGCNPIYIIGCDHYYAGESNVSAGVAIEQSEDQNHFIKNYRQPGEIVLPAPIREMEIAYRAAREYCDANNIKIYNATRGGYLEIFERADLDEILDNQ